MQSVETDWVRAGLETWRDHSKTNETYSVQHVAFADGRVYRLGGSYYRKTVSGYDHVALENSHILAQPSPKGYR